MRLFCLGQGDFKKFFSVIWRISPLPFNVIPAKAGIHD
jgi:hypothetical protein